MFICLQRAVCFHAVKRASNESEIVPRMFILLTKNQDVLNKILPDVTSQQCDMNLSFPNYYINLLYNVSSFYLSVCSERRVIGSDFAVSFARIFNVRIVRWPESITLQVSV